MFLRTITACLAMHAATLAVAGTFSGDISRADWSSNRLLDDTHSLTVVRVHAAADWGLGSALRVVANGWADSEGGAHGGFASDLTELYVQAASLPCRPALGQRVVTWGRTDTITPTDRVSPTNFLRLTPDNNEQRLGVLGLHMDCAAGQGRLQVHLLDRFRFNTVPLPAIPGGRIEEPALRLRPTLAVRYDLLHSFADAAVGWTEGYDLFPTLALSAASPAGALLTTTATRMRMIGGDVAVSRGSLVLRGELAWAAVVKDTSPSASAALFTARRSSLVQAAVQLETTFANRETLTLQLFARQLLDDLPAESDPLRAALQRAQGLISNEVDPLQGGLTVRYSIPIDESRGNVDFLALWALPQREGLLRARVGYDISTAWRVTSGFDVFRGPPNSFFGNLRSNSLAFAEIRYGW